MPKKKILIDLDVVTIAYFPSKDIRKEDSLKFIKRAENKEFVVCTPSNFELLLFKWEFKELRDKILDFYKITSDKFVDYVVSFNRKHLKNKEYEINEVLKKNGLAQIKIRFPNEI